MAIEKVLLSSVLAIGTSTAGAIGIQKIFLPKTVEEQLQRENVEILKTTEQDNSSDWQTKVSENSSKQEARDFINRQKDQSSNANTTEVNEINLKDACSKVMKKPNKDPDLKDARDFCTKPKVSKQ